MPRSVKSILAEAVTSAADQLPAGSRVLMVFEIPDGQEPLTMEIAANCEPALYMAMCIQVIDHEAKKAGFEPPSDELERGLESGR